MSRTVALLLALCAGWLVGCGEDLAWSWRDVPAGHPRSCRPDKEVSDVDFHIVEQDGLAADQVNAVVQMANGAMVFGTNHGMSIWREGVITTYTGPEYCPLQDRTIPGNSGLPSNHINDLLVSADGALWVATTKGVCRLRGSRWQVLKPKPTQSSYDSSGFDLREQLGDVQRLYQASTGTIVVGSRMAGVTVIDPKTDETRILYHNTDPNNWVTSIAEDSNGCLWIGVFGLGVLHYDGEFFTLYTELEPWIPEANIRCLCIDDSGALWVGTHRGLGVRLPDGSSQVFTEPGTLPDDTVWKLWVRNNGDVWAVTDEGIAVFDGSAWTYPVCEPDPVGPHTGFLESRDGALWMGGWFGAVMNPTFDVKTTSPMAGRLLQLKQRIESEYPDVTLSELVVRGRQDRIWAYESDRLLCFDGKRWKDLSHLVAEDTVSVLKVDSKGRVWIGTIGAGLIGYDGGKVLRFNNAAGWAGSVIYDVVEDSRGILYVGTQDGLYRLAGENWEDLSEKFLPRMHLQLSLLLVDREDRVWFADPNNGLFLYDGTTIVHVSARVPLKGRDVTDIRVTPSGSLHVSTLMRTAAGPVRRSFLCNDRTCVPIDGGSQQ